MRRLSSVAAVAVGLTALALSAAPAAIAGDVGATDDLAGRWKTAALKMNGGAGYAMTLRHSGEAGSYDARLRFSYTDGRQGSLIRASVTAAGSAARMTFTGDSGATTTLKGSIGMDGSLWFPTCYRVLPLITKAEAPAACLFQEMPS